MPKIVIFSGAGMSAESGINTFRDHDGLWGNHKIEEVATPEAWQKILNWYKIFIMHGVKMYWQHSPI